MDFFCSFCGRARQEVRKLISGPRIFICDACVDACVRTAATGEAPRPDQPRSVRLLAGGPDARGLPEKCSFCAEQRRYSRLAFGSVDPNFPEHCICAACVGLSIEIMAEESQGEISDELRSWPEVSAEVRDRRPTSR